jgi:hypothetical protein
MILHDPAGSRNRAFVLDRRTGVQTAITQPAILRRWVSDALRSSQDPSRLDGAPTDREEPRVAA